MNNKASHRQQLINLYTRLAEKPDQDFVAGVKVKLMPLL